MALTRGGKLYRNLLLKYFSSKIDILMAKQKNKKNHVSLKKSTV